MAISVTALLNIAVHTVTAPLIGLLQAVGLGLAIAAGANYAICAQITRSAVEANQR